MLAWATRVRTIRLALCIILVASAGCEPILGVDEYHTGDVSPDGPGAPIHNTCNSDEVLDGKSGECVAVGVRPEACSKHGFGFDESGGCTTALPSADCQGAVVTFGSPGACGSATNDPCTAQSNPYPGAGNLSADQILYADASASGSTGNGSLASPFGTIGKALERAAQPPYDGKQVYVFVRGTFQEDVVVSRSRVDIRGCQGNATIVGQKELVVPGDLCFPKDLIKGNIPFQRSAAVCVLPSTAGVSMRGLTISGRGDGVSVVGAGTTDAEITFTDVRIQDTSYYGMRIADAMLPDASTAPSAVRLSRVAISGAHGAGIDAVGSSLNVEDSSVVNTVPLNAWADDPLRAADPDGESLSSGSKTGWARGISIHAGQWTTDGASPDPDTFLKSQATIAHTVLVGHPEMALFAQGASVQMTDSYVCSSAAAHPAGRGIVLHHGLPVDIPTSLIMNGVIIEHTTDAAIDVLHASLDATDTTIRDTQGRDGDGCSGQGVRVRSLPLDSSGATATLTDSTITKSRQSGVFAAASTLKLTGVLVSGVEPTGKEPACRVAMGDGIALERYRGQSPTDATLDHVRVEGASRAAISSADASVHAQNTVLSCSARNFVSTLPNGAAPKLDAVCGCDASWSKCETARVPLTSWVASGPSPAWPDRQAQLSYCMVDFLQTRPLEKVAIWSDAEVEPTVTDASGCAWLPGLPPMQPVLFWRPGFTAGKGILVPYAGESYTNTLLGELTLSVGALGWPAGVPIATVTHAPPGAEVVEPDGIVISGIGLVLKDRIAVPGPNMYVSSLEPGWHSVQLKGVKCDGRPSLDMLGNSADPKVRYAPTDWGYFEQTLDFGACSLTTP